MSELEALKKELFKSAMQGAWDKVLKIYKDNREMQEAKITRSGSTALHIAVSEGREEIVAQLVNMISGPEGRNDALEIGDDRGNTPLHLAAYLGNVRMCECIAEVDSKLIGARNKDNETPFFMAVSNGRRDAFLCLHSFCKNGEGYSYCRGNDGETILHSAIAGEYFDLAFQILNLYEGLINAVNVRGLSPLHLLARKPTSFRSGTHLRGFQKVIYHCTFVEELKQKAHGQLPLQEEYPELDKYGTCIRVASLLWKGLKVLVGLSKNKHTDAENPVGQPIDHKKGRDLTLNFRAQRNQPSMRAEENQPSMGRQGHQLFPPNYLSCFEAMKLISKVIMIILGLGSNEIVKIREKKEKHTWALQIMEKLLQKASLYEYDYDGKSPQKLPLHGDGGPTPHTLVDGENVTGFAFFPGTSPPIVDDSESSQEDRGEGNPERKPRMEETETPILMAARTGVLEMVERILKLFPVAINDVNADKKNIVLLAVESRQPHVYEFLVKKMIMKETLFRQVDIDGNSALHLASMLGDHRPWVIPGAALQLQWEIKWFKFVEKSMPRNFFARYNKYVQTPEDLFTEKHKGLLQEGSNWLNSTSESCSVVAALIATVAFATSSTVPGGVKQENGAPTLEGEPAFSIFAVSSLIALCFSVTSVVMFLAILTSRSQEKDFYVDLPRKLLVGLTSLFVSIAAMLVSFCAGHFFVLKDKLEYAALPVYAVTCVPVTLFAMGQFPLYIDLLWATFKKVPQRNYK